jgi:NitT/TauT family transport system ATP-binding protein
MAHLEIIGLSHEFRRDEHVVLAIGGLDLSVAEGEFVTLVGPSGCGKSTLLHLVAGFETPTAGQILLDGSPVRRPGPDRGMLFQDLALFPWRSVISNIAWGLEARGMSRREREEIASRYMEMVGLTAFRDAYPSELSGGMKQRVALARVLAFEPRILLMDEPFGSLDAQTRELMQDELTRIWQSASLKRKTVVFVTHDIDEAIFLADRVILMTARPGRLKRSICVELPRPRAAEIRLTPEYTSYRNLIWDLLREEVLASRSVSV